MVDIHKYHGNQILWRELVYSLQNYLGATFGKSESWLVEDMKEILKTVKVAESEVQRQDRESRDGGEGEGEGET